MTVTPGRRRARVHSWVFGAVAACLVLAIGVGMSLGSGMFSTSDNASSSSSAGSEDNNAAGEPMLESTSSATSDETQDTATWNGYSDGLHVESLVGGRVEFDDGTAEDVLDMQVNFGSVDFRCASAEPAEPDTVGDFLGVATWSFPDIGELSDLLNVYALASDTSGVAVPDTILVEIPLADGSAVYYPFNQV